VECKSEIAELFAWISESGQAHFGTMGCWRKTQGIICGFLMGYLCPSCINILNPQQPETLGAFESSLGEAPRSASLRGLQGSAERRLSRTGCGLLPPDFGPN
jgi:hypothetical protein